MKHSASLFHFLINCVEDQTLPAYKKLRALSGFAGKTNPLQPSGLGQGFEGHPVLSAS